MKLILLLILSILPISLIAQTSNKDIEINLKEQGGLSIDSILKSAGASNDLIKKVKNQKFTGHIVPVKKQQVQLIFPTTTNATNFQTITINGKYGIKQSQFNINQYQNRIVIRKIY